MITRRQLNIIANAATEYGDGGERAAVMDVSLKLFPEDQLAIHLAVQTHPINTNWDEYVSADPTTRATKFHLP